MSHFPAPDVPVRERFSIEATTIEPVPLNQRHGRARDLFTIWFGCQIGAVPLITGALATTVYHLPIVMGIVALFAGNIVGALLMALHSAQGAKLGVPQMIQSRGQFGSIGALVLVLVALGMYVGFYASTLLTGVSAVEQLFPGTPTAVWIVVGVILAIVVTWIGYDMIHRLGRWLTWFGVAAYALVAIAMVIHGLPAGVATNGTASFAGFIGTFTVAAVWQIAYAPYVSDYSRYMPANAASQRSTFWATYLGCSLGAAIPMTLGAILGLGTNSDVIAALPGFVGPVVSVLVFILFAITTLHLNSLNVYGGMLTSITAIQTFKADWRPSPRARLIAVSAFAIVGGVLALFTVDTFLASYNNFLGLLTFFLVPWSVINLLDYYVIKHGSYDVQQFFRPRGGTYGLLNGAALSAYLIGLAVQVPFMTSAFYTGPLYGVINGDVSWIIGAIVSVPAYLLLARSRRTGPTEVPVEPAMRAEETV
jgi:NCS1 family nucleobase:cation symporter-1